MYMREQFHDQLPELPDTMLFDVTQAAHWFIRDRDNAFSLLDMPALVPPYEEMWMEYPTPAKIRMDDQIVNKHPKDVAVGCHARVQEVSPEAAKWIADHVDTFLTEAFKHSNWEHNVHWYISPLPEIEIKTTSIKWFVTFHFFGWGHDVCAHDATTVMLLDEHGKYITHKLAICPTSLIRLTTGYEFTRADAIANSMVDDQELSKMFVALEQGQFPFFFCLSLLHCRNVQTVDKPASPAPILKQRAKKGIPYIQYKVLEVTPLRTVREGGTRKDGTPEPKALHFVRGHFKDFSVKGLFGKYKGVYWWDSQVRGDVSKGIIDKDYKVNRG